MSIEPYSHYKESGVEWIGEIPSAWSVTAVRRAAKLVTERAGERTNPVALENIESWTGRFIKTEGSYEGEGTAFLPGDVLFGKLRPYLAKAWLATDRGEAIGDFHVLRCGDAAEPAFLQRILLSKEVISQIDGSTYGAKMPRVGWDFLASLYLPMPPRPEQTAIVAFLDRETAKIDDLIAEQERLIGLLDEKRQAVILHAVTKGLDPNAPMKDSGLEWIGRISDSWHTEKVKHVSPQVTVGVVVTPSAYYVDSGVIALRSFNIEPMQVNPRDVVYFSEDTNTKLAKSKLSEGDLVCVRTGTPGVTSEVGPEFDGVNCIDLIIIRKSDKFRSRFLSYVMNSEVCRIQYERDSQGALHQHFNVETAENLQFVCPDVSEQDKIVSFLDSTVSTIDALKFEVDMAIKLLVERRSALISAAVTGKIDVRGLVAAASSMQEAAE